jgi:hypothetical protein
MPIVPPREAVANEHGKYNTNSEQKAIYKLFRALLGLNVIFQRNSLARLVRTEGNGRSSPHFSFRQRIYQGCGKPGFGIDVFGCLLIELIELIGVIYQSK